jgi:hypothetical protein
MLDSHSQLNLRMCDKRMEEREGGIVSSYLRLDLLHWQPGHLVGTSCLKLFITVDIRDRATLGEAELVRERKLCDRHCWIKFGKLGFPLPVTI